MEKAIADYSDETGRKPEISSLFRTREEQARAYLNYLRGGGLAAPPGHSRHEIGEAADLNTDAKFANWLKSGNRASKYGMEFLPGHAGQIDPYHIQLNRRSAEK
jgi:LAS superfamily LD-carboxypeptidase LdcB